MATPDTPTVLVVGAGPAGLAAALKLKASGERVLVLEREREVGGRSGVDLAGGFSFDRGAEFVTSFYNRSRELIAELGLDGALVRLPIDGEVVFDGRRFPLAASASAVLGSPLLSGRSKRRVLTTLTPFLICHGGKLRWSELERAAELDDQSAADCLAELVGQEYVEGILKPTLETLTLSPSGETSRVIALAQAREAAGSSLLCPQGGLIALWRTAAARVPLRTGAEVLAVVRSGDEVEVRLASGEVLRARAAVIAVPPSDLLQIADGSLPECALAAEARFSPAVKVHLRLDRPIPQRPLCPAGPGDHAIAGISLLDRKGTGQTPAGRGGLVICAAPRLGRELLSASDEAVCSRLVPEAEKLMGGQVPGILGASVVRLPEGVPTFYVGWIRKLAAMRRLLAPGAIAVAGDWLASPSIEGAVRTGEEAAERVLAHVRAQAA